MGAGMWSSGRERALAVGGRAGKAKTPDDIIVEPLITIDAGIEESLIVEPLHELRTGYYVKV
jgi:hypothetical protein